MSEQQMEVEDEKGGDGRGGGSLLPELLSYPLLSSECLSFPRSERHNIVPPHADWDSPSVNFTFSLIKIYHLNNTISIPFVLLLTFPYLILCPLPPIGCNSQVRSVGQLGGVVIAAL